MSQFSDAFRAYAAPDLMTKFGDSVSYYADSDSGTAVPVDGIFSMEPAKTEEDALGENQVVEAILSLGTADAALVSLPGQFEVSGERWAVIGTPVLKTGLYDYSLVRIMRSQLRNSR